MIHRFVKLSVATDQVPAFLAIFATAQPHITALPACLSLALYQQTDCNGTTVFFTRSVWQSADDLEAYRQSDFFKITWATVKPLFNAPAEAWTLAAIL